MTTLPDDGEGGGAWARKVFERAKETVDAMTMSKYKAEIVPFSSVVGQSVSLIDAQGVAALIMISIPQPSRDYKATAVPIAEHIARSFGAAALSRQTSAQQARGLVAALDAIASGGLHYGEAIEIARAALKQFEEGQK